MWQQSRQHLASVGEGYFGHQRRALGFALNMLGAGLALAAHAIVPGWFVTTGSDTVFRLNAIMRARAEKSGQRHDP